MYRSLDPEKIVETCRLLRRRIEERFPGSGLGRVAAELLTVSEQAAAISKWLARPHLPLRVLAAAMVAAMVALLVHALSVVELKETYSTASDLFQGLEAVTNEIVFLCVAAFFLVTIEVRVKRRRALGAIHVLRSLAHIVDMHQLTKDPEVLLRRGSRTSSSPQRTLSPFELTRYLDYCSEMLAIVSKVAAVYVQKFDDPVTLSAVNDVEGLAAALSRKIWQKIVILDRMVPPAE